MRFCKKCKQEKEDEEFYSHKDGLKRYECKACAQISALKYLYGLEYTSYLGLLEKQKNLCAICNKEKRLCVDHDHNTGEVRGLLCAQCNSYLGVIERDPSILDRIRSYI